MGVNPFSEALERVLGTFVETFTEACGACRGSGECSVCEDGTETRYLWDQWEKDGFAGNGKEPPTKTAPCSACKGTQVCYVCRGKGTIGPDLGAQMGFVSGEVLITMQSLREREQFTEAWDLLDAGLDLYMRLRQAYLSESGVFSEDTKEKLGEYVANLTEVMEPKPPRVTLRGGGLSEEELQELLGEDDDGAV